MAVHCHGLTSLSSSTGIEIVFLIFAFALVFVSRGSWLVAYPVGHRLSTTVSEERHGTGQTAGAKPDWQRGDLRTEVTPVAGVRHG